MNQKKLWIIGVVCILLIGVGILLNVTKSKNELSDSLKFKQEYEALNNTVRESDGATYNNISIKEKNPIKYVNCQEAIEVLKKDNAILYVGAEWCPWCRSAVPILFEVAEKYGVDTIYYLNLDQEKSTYEIKDKELKKVTNGTDAYYELLKNLDSHLSEYTLKDEDGKVYNTGEKRIYMPFVLTIKNGKVLDTHVGTTTLNKNQTKYDPLTEEQKKTVYKTYESMIKPLYEPGVCNDEDSCN